MTRDYNTILSGLILESTIGAREDGGKTFQMPIDKMHEASIVKALRYGFQRWINDRVGGKDVKLQDKLDDTSVFLAKVMDGSWQHMTKTRDSVDLRTKIARKLVWAKLGKDKRKELSELENAGVNEILDALIAKNAEKLAPAIDKEIARLEAEAKAMAGLELDVTF